MHLDHAPTRRRTAAGRGRLARAAARVTAPVLVLLAGCAGEFTTQTEALRLVSDGLPAAIIGEPYSAAVEAVGGLRPYDFSVRSGTLPPGVALEGGSLRGTPTTAGTFEFSIVVSDANLSSTFATYTLAVVTPPPASLSLQPPATEVRRRVTLRARVTDARSLVGLRTEITWDDAAFTLVADSVAASRQGLALFWDAAPGRLNVDTASLTGPLDGAAQLFTFALEPRQAPALVAVASVTEFASRRGGQLLLDVQRRTEGPGTLSPAPVPVGSPPAAPGDDAPDSDAPGSAPDTEPPATPDGTQAGDGAGGAP